MRRTKEPFRCYSVIISVTVLLLDAEQTADNGAAAAAHHRGQGVAGGALGDRACAGGLAAGYGVDDIGAHRAHDRRSRVVDGLLGHLLFLFSLFLSGLFCGGCLLGGSLLRCGGFLGGGLLRLLGSLLLSLAGSLGFLLGGLSRRFLLSLARTLSLQLDRGLGNDLVGRLAILAVTVL